MPDGPAVRRRAFDPVATAVANARRFVCDTVSALHSETLDVLLEDIALLTSELATNAVLHGRTAFSVEVATMGPVLRVDVVDDGAGRPLVRSFSSTAGSGRGLRLLDTLSTRWGSEPLPSGPGKRVWFEIDSRETARSTAELAIDFDKIEAL